MARIFPPYFNVVARASIFAAVVIVGAAGWAWFQLSRSDFVQLTSYPVEQPVQFSHQHHVDRLGIECRFCHTTVEHSPSAGMPPTYTCMTCHSQIWRNTAMLAPVRLSLDADIPIKWRRVYDTPAFVFFDHHAHVAKGIGCAECHGPVDRKALMVLEQPLYMRWCLDCHRNPEKFVRPKEEVFNMRWQHPSDQRELGTKLVSQYGIKKLEDCSVCHR